MTDRTKPDQCQLTYIYGITNEEGRKTKLGRSVNPEVRRRNLQTGNPDNLRVDFVRVVEHQNGSKIEATAKRDLDLQKVPRSKEWHTCPPTRVKTAVDSAIVRVRANNRTLFD